MTIAYTGGSTNGGESDTATSGVHGVTINSGDLVGWYINGNDTTAISVNADAGADWTTAFDEAVSGQTAHQAFFWKIADGSEPTSYTADLTDSRNFQAVLIVFTSATDLEIDASQCKKSASAPSSLVLAAASISKSVAEVKTINTA